MNDEVVFFGMDVFAGQFGLSGITVVRFDPETGETANHSTDLEAWAATILDDYSCETGYHAAHEWQLRHGPLQYGDRLLPRLPFVLGGAYSADNLVAWPLQHVMEQFARLHAQIRDVADGCRVTLKGWLDQHV